MHGVGPFLPGHFRGMAGTSEREQTRLARDAARIGLTADGAGGLATLLTYGALGLLLWSGAMDLAVAGTAVRRSVPARRELRPAGYWGSVASWIRLPQVSSKTAVVTGPISSGSCVKRTPRSRRRSYSAVTSSTANWASGMPSSTSASR